MKQYPYLRSRKRRGRWAHYYKRFDPTCGKEVEIPLGVHGLHPTDPQVLSAWAAEHARWEHSPPGTETPANGSFAWAVDIYKTGPHWNKKIGEETRKNRSAILKRYVISQGPRPLNTITTEDIEAALAVKGGNAAVNEFKAIKPVFEYAAKLRLIPRDPTLSIKVERPKTVGFPTASADGIAQFQIRWKVGTTERLIFDLGLFTGAARVDLAQLGRRHIEGDTLVFKRNKTGVESIVPLTRELRAVIARTPDIAPTFILSDHGKSYAKESLGNRFRDAAQAAGVGFRLHGLRKAFCVYWAEEGKSPHQIAAMAGHITLGEVERYTRDADRRRMIQLLAEGS